METRSATVGTPHWTLADFLSTYRYWALFFSSLFVALAGQGLNAILPMMAQIAGTTFETISTFYVGLSGGWIIGAFVAFVVASRHGRSALIWPVAACILVTVVFVSMSSMWSSPIFLTIFGMACGAAHAVFPLAIAIFLVGGRAGKIDFGCALVLLSTTILAANFAPVGASLLYQLDDGGFPVVIGFLTCLLVAILFLLPARNLGFEDAPRPRHKPLRPQYRSPVLVAVILLSPPVLLFLVGFFVYALSPVEFEAGEFSAVTLSLLSLVVCIAVAVFVYLAYWAYRIHGELAGAAASQRLLTPIAGLLVTILVPLGLPVLLMTLGDLLNDRAKEKGDARAVSIAWLAIWTILLPPIAIAMVQNAANASYGDVPEAAG